MKFAKIPRVSNRDSETSNSEGVVIKVRYSARALCRSESGRWRVAIKMVALAGRNNGPRTRCTSALGLFMERRRPPESEKSRQPLAESRLPIFRFSGTLGLFCLDSRSAAMRRATCASVTNRVTGARRRKIASILKAILG